MSATGLSNRSGHRQEVLQQGAETFRHPGAVLRRTRRALARESAREKERITTDLVHEGEKPDAVVAAAKASPEKLGKLVADMNRTAA